MKVSYILPDGAMSTYRARSGDTLLDVALDNAVPGIKGQCGGGCTCCTCHCWIEPAWLATLDKPHQDELDLLAYAWGRTGDSRLACQVRLSEARDGICVRVPQQQS